MCEDVPKEESPKGRKRIRKRYALALAVPSVLVLGFAGAWLNRETIADNIIADALAKNGINARYKIASIGPDKQILNDIEIGDPASPDLTIEWAIVTIKPRFGFPHIENIRLVRPRLQGSFRNGALSFGALDPLIFTKSEDPFALPDLNVTVEDGGALMVTDFGRFGASLSGQGNLADGFKGELGVASRGVAAGGCAFTGASLYGQIAISGQRPSFSGPLRLAGAKCAEDSAGFADLVANVKLRGSADLADWEGESAVALSRAFGGGAQSGKANGDVRFTWRDQALTARYDLTAQNLSSAEARVAKASLEGQLRSLRNFERVEVTGSVAGDNLTLGAPVVAMVQEAKRAGQGSPVSPIVSKIGTALLRQAKGSKLAADYTVRVNEDSTSVVVPMAGLRGGSGESLLALSRLQLLFKGGRMAEISGNFATSGDDLPRIEGRMQRSGREPARLTMAMAPYTAGTSRVSVPRLEVQQLAAGALQFAGQVLASGDIPGGRVEGLALPLNGNWSGGAGLAMGAACTPVAFERLQLASLSLGRNTLTLCPNARSALVRYSDAGGLRVGGGLTQINMEGMLGESPITLRSGPVAFSYPGNLTAEGVAVTLGEASSPNRFNIANLTADFRDGVAGEFAGTDVGLSVVPLNLSSGAGQWRFADGRLDLSQASFRVDDRAPTPRFEPLIAQNAVLSLENNRITSTALLREPVTNSAVVRVVLAHNLDNTSGSADLTVNDLTFDRSLQPTHLTDMARGMIANVRGAVSGTGRINWTPDSLTSSGRFTTKGLDLAAPFGPVRGLSGTINFTDLLNLTTAPNQEMRIAAIDPGVEIFDGIVRYSLTDATLLKLSHGAWPLMGGRLVLEPVDIRFGASEVRRYSFQIEGLDAARVVSHMELNNIGASGLFDGAVPVVFDAKGNGRLEGGMLISRPPGGSVSYVGELTYEDLSPMANYAFGMLRTLKYESMSVQLDGPLAGDIVTKVRFDGVSQGEGTKQNFITRKIAQLPIRFVMNIRAPFYSLMGSMRALYDPSAIRDPREVGLLDKQGTILRRESDGMPQMQPTSNDPVNKDEL